MEKGEGKIWNSKSVKGEAGRIKQTYCKEQDMSSRPFVRRTEITGAEEQVYNVKQINLHNVISTTGKLKICECTKRTYIMDADRKRRKCK